MSAGQGVRLVDWLAMCSHCKSAQVPCVCVWSWLSVTTQLWLSIGENSEKNDLDHFLEPTNGCFVVR